MSLSRWHEQIAVPTAPTGWATQNDAPTNGRRAMRWFYGPLWLIAAGIAIVVTRGESKSGPPPPPPPAMPTIWTPDVSPIGATGNGSTLDARRSTPGRRGVRNTGSIAPASSVEHRASSHSPYRLRRLVMLGQPAAGGGFHGGSFEIDDLNRAGQALIGSDMENPWGRGEALYLMSRDRETRIAAPGDPGPEGRRYGTIIWMPPGLNERGQAVWAGQMENGEPWLLTFDSRTGRSAVVSRPGMAAPGGGEFQSQGRQRIVINNAGDIAFDGYVPGPSRVVVPGVFLVADGEMRVVAREGTPASDGDLFRTAETPSMNDGREIAFQGTTQRSQWWGVYLWQDGFVTPVAVPGTRLLAPKSQRRSLQAAFYPQIDNHGRVVFIGRTDRGDGLYRWARGTIRPILEAGDIVAGVGRLDIIHFHRRRPFFVNARGDIAFSGEVGGRSGVFVWKQGAIEVVVRSDETLPGVGTLTQVGSPDAGGGAYPYGGVGGMGPPPGYGGPPGSMGSPRGGGGAPPGYMPPPGMGPGGGPAPPGTGPGGGYGPPNSFASGYGGYGPPPGREARTRGRGDGTTRRRGETARTGRDARPSPYGAPYGMPGAGLYGGYFGQPFGLVLSDDGKVLLPAMVDGKPCVILATPRSGDRHRGVPLASIAK